MQAGCCEKTQRLLKKGEFIYYLYLKAYRFHDFEAWNSSNDTV